jgi:hypothetical protein
MRRRPQHKIPAEAAIPGASLEAILCAEKLRHRRSRQWYRPYIPSVVLAVFLSAGARSQTQLATVSGAITDPSGAVVPTASVTVVNQGTGLKRSVLTDTAGEYRFAGLPTGTYSLRISKPEFQSQIRAGVELNSAADVTINAQLVIGDLSQQANVSAARQIQLAGRFIF